MWANHPQYLDKYNKVRITALPNYLKARILVPSGLHIAEWRRLLTGYHDANMADFLNYGWPIDYTAATPPHANHSQPQ